MKLEDKSVIVTGASSGIGEAIAAGFAREGARVVTWGRNLDKLTKAKHRAGKASERLLPRLVDVADQNAVNEAMQEAIEILGSIDVLVNNAGTNIPNRTLKDLSIEDFNTLVDVNLKGVFYCMHAVLPHMRIQQSGLIITVSSISGKRIDNTAGTAYIASKFGASALSRAVGLEESNNGIRSCLICPGEINTPILDKRPLVPSPEKRALMLQPEDLAQTALFLVNLPERATVPEIIITPRTQKYY